MRRATRRLHRYLGWVSGAIVAILCATGCILLLQPEIEGIADPERRRLKDYRETDVVMPLDEFVETVERRESASFERPTTTRISRLSIDRDPRRPRRALIEARDAASSWTYIAYLDPRSGEGVAYGASRTLGFFVATRRLHTRLCISPPKVGRAITGTATLVFFFTLATGLMRWLPAKLKNVKSWREGLTIRFKKGSFRAIYSAHKALGFYGAAVLMALALSGCWLSFGWFRALCDRAIGFPPAASAETRFDLPALTEEVASAPSLDDLLASQNSMTPDADYDVFLPAPGESSPLVFARVGAFFYHDRYYWDRRTGEFLGATTYGDLPTSRKIRSAITPFHKGELYGSATRYLFLLCCVIGVVLVATGYWLTLKRWDAEEGARESRRNKAERRESKI